MMSFGILLILRMKNLHFDVAQHTFKALFRIVLNDFWCKFVLIVTQFADNVDGSRSTGFKTASLSTDTELNRMQYISITTNTRITATVC